MNTIMGQGASGDASAPSQSRGHQGTVVGVLILSPALHVLYANEYARDLIWTNAPGRNQDSATGGLWEAIKEICGAINQAQQGLDRANRSGPSLVTRLIADPSGHRLLVRGLWLPDLRESSRCRVLILLQEPGPEPVTAVAA